MNPIYNSNCQVVSWQSAENIYHLNGSHAAVINGDNVYGHSGQHLGILTSGYFRDQNGGAVAFFSDATGGPIPPIPPIPAIPSLGWGSSWDQFINA